MRFDTVAALRVVAETTIHRSIAIGVAAIVAGIIVSVWMSGSKIVRPLLKLSDQMRALANRDLKQEIDGVGRADEIGGMARALQTFKDNALALQAAEAQAAGERRRNEAIEAQRKAEAEIAARQREEALHALAEGLERLAAQDLTYRIGADLAVDYKRLKDDFNAAMGEIETALAAVIGSTQTIGGATNEIAAATDDLSRRSEQQAAALEQTAAAMAEITRNVKRAASAAANANGIVGTAKSGAELSGDIVGSAVEAMSRIEKSSQEINQIIGVIDEIAFQTNLLALNAGVEAARAGEAGKGFAVVASEVRALAQRAAEAAKEIKTLISASSGQVTQGVDLVRRTGESLDLIVTQVVQISGLIAEIAEGANDQAGSLAEVNSAIGQLDQDTQKNAAMVEETTAASHSLRLEADELTRVIGKFRIATARESAPRGARPALKTLAAAAPARQTRAEAESWAEF